MKIGCLRYLAKYLSTFSCIYRSVIHLNFEILHRHFVTASYDGHLHLFDYSQNPIINISVHQSHITSVCVVPSSNTESRILASSSHDLTACLTRVSLSSNGSAPAVASLHLHTGSVSCISSDSSGPHLLTSSWDGLVGVWDTSIPDDHQVALDRADDKKK